MGKQLNTHSNLNDKVFTRILIYFLFGCLLSRIGIAYLVYVSPKKWLKYISVLYLCIGMGIGFQWVTKSRKKGAFSNQIWWDHMRIFHCATFLFVAYTSYRGLRGWAWKMLVVDALVSLIAFLHHHRKELSS